MKRFPSLPLLALLLACGSALGAGTPIEQHRAVNADARIDISNVKGAVNVTAWDKAEVAISGTLGEGAKGLAIEGGGDHLSIKVQAPDHQGWFSWGADARMGDTVLDLKVPRSAALKIEVVSADVNVTGVAGRSLDVHSVSGKLRLDSGADEVEIDTVSGNIDLSGRATQGHLQTVSGNIRTRGLGGQLKFESVSGDISADNAAYHELDAQHRLRRHRRARPPRPGRAHRHRKHERRRAPEPPRRRLHAPARVQLQRHPPQRLRHHRAPRTRPRQQPRRHHRQRCGPRQDRSVQRRRRDPQAVAERLAAFLARALARPNPRAAGPLIVRAAHATRTAPAP